MSKRRRRQPAFFTGAFPSTPPPREGPFPTMPALDYSDPTMKFGKSGYGIRMVSAPKRGADPASQPAFYDESFTPDTVPTPAPRPPMPVPGLALAPAAAPQVPPPSPQGASVAALAPHVPAMVAQNPGMLPDPGRQRGVTFATQGMMGKGVWNRDTYDRFTQNMQPGDAAALGTPLRSAPNASAPVYSEQMQGIAPNATPEQARRLLGLRSGVLTTNQAGQDFLARQRGASADPNNPAFGMRSVASRRAAIAESDKDRAMAGQKAQIAANKPMILAGQDGKPVAVTAFGKMGMVQSPEKRQVATERRPVRNPDGSVMMDKKGKPITEDVTIDLQTGEPVQPDVDPALAQVGKMQRELQQYLQSKKSGWFNAGKYKGSDSKVQAEVEKRKIAIAQELLRIASGDRDKAIQLAQQYGIDIS